MAASHRTRQDISWPWEENEGPVCGKDRETGQRARVNRVNIRGDQEEKRLKRFLNKLPLQEKGLLFGLYSGAEVIEVLSDAMLIYGIPEHIRSDNGPE